ncbi:MAG: carboxypeptidase regulatory-like domain-containing protein, partial [Gammaproteobacteria bacterium]|nr:carboxypeptidase regulatory-like domain-containing protein [Gammaproteobacteria bacterium]
MKYMDLYGEAGRYFLRDWPKSKELKSAGLEILHLLLSPEWNELDGWNKQSELLLKTLKSLSHLSVRLARKCLYAVKNYFNSRYFNSLKKYVVYEYLWGSFKLTVESSLFKCLQQDLIALDTKLTASLEKTNTIKTKVGKLAAILLQTIYKSSRSASHKPFETFTLMLGLQISSAFALPTTRSSYDTSQVATISNCQQLQNIQTNLAGQYQLVGDIDCTATRTWNTGAGFNPVGKFTGILNGDGYSIGNLYVKRPNENFIGFFSIITNQARVMNVVLTNATVLGGHNDMVGGFVGWIQAAGIVSNCHVNAVVQAPSAQKVGGLVGVNDGTILESSSSGTVEGYGTTGGLLGANNAGTVIGSHSSSAVQSPFNDGYVGGLVGNNDRGIRNSYATGPVKGPYNVGGLVGWHRGNGVISNCYALGAASGPVAGGLVGTVDGQVTHAYSVGKVSTTGVAGGLVAKVNAGSVSNSYYDTTTSGQKDTGRGTPKTTADMTKQATYQGWNFASIWEINEGDTYPSIRSKPLQITFSEIKCSQTIRVPFPVAISTKDTNFNSRVNLFSKRGPVFPRWISMVNGKWFGNVTVYFIGKNTQLNLQWVDAHSTTHYGMSNAFDVVNDQGVIPDDATLMGVVIDSNQVAIANVTVKIYLSDPNKGAKPIYEITTNPDGQYQVMHVVPTELYLKIQKSGYQTIIQIVETEEGAQVSCNVELGLACTETDFENIEAPVLLVPGIMGSKESGWIYPRLSKKPTAWNAHKLSLLNPVNAAGWNTIKNLLKDQGYKEDCTLIDVPYHWTLSVPDIRDLYLKPWIDYIKKESGKDQVDIIAHSMGGLVARSYIQSFNYGNDVRKLAIVGTPNEGSSTLYFIWEGGDPIAGDKANGNPDGSWFGIAKYFYTNTLSYLGENILDEKLCDFNVGSWVPNSCDTEAVYHFLHEYGPAAHSLLATYDHALLDQNGRSTPIEKEENAFLKALNVKPCYQSGGCVDSSGVPYVFKAPAEAMSGDPSKVQTKLFVGIGEKTPASLVVKQQTLGGDLYQDGFPTHDYWTDFGDGSVLVSSVIFNGSFPVG